MTAPAEEVLAKLIVLSKHDLKIRQLDQDLKRAPASLKAKEDGIKATNAQLAKLEDTLRRFKSQIMLRESEVKGFDEKIERLKGQSSEVRTNKEFVAFRSEIANAAAESDRVQNEILKSLEVAEQAEAKIERLKAKRAELGAHIEDIRKQTAEQLLDVQRERDAFEAGRAGLSAGIPKEHILTYERARRARGNGVVALEGAYCGGCGAQVTKNDMYAVQNRTRVVTCIPCNRILYPAGIVLAAD